MLVKVRVSGYITLEIPPCSIDEDTKQVWLNEFSNWVKDAQEEFTVPAYDDVETYIEDLDFIVED